MFSGTWVCKHSILDHIHEQNTKCLGNFTLAQKHKEYVVWGPANMPISSASASLLNSSQKVHSFGQIKHLQHLVHATHCIVNFVQHCQKDKNLEQMMKIHVN